MEHEALHVKRGELPKLFDPRFRYSDRHPSERLKGLSPQELEALAKDVRTSISRCCSTNSTCGHVENRNGEYVFSGEAKHAIHAVSGALAALLTAPTVVELPREKSERKAFTEALVDSAFHYDGKHTIYAPVCPDYSRGSDFYKNIGTGISPEARGAINATRILTGEYSKYLIPKVKILVADTEDDIQDVMQNVVAGQITVYKARCEASAQSIREDLSDVSKSVEVMTFTQCFGRSFRIEQQNYETYIRQGIAIDEALRAKVQSLMVARAERHAQILGRIEIDGELTIRYMAQYMALGSLLSGESRTFVMNYPTPNREYLNPAKNPFYTEKIKTVPILGTVVER
jgi:nitrogen regulatory protein PII